MKYIIAVIALTFACANAYADLKIYDACWTEVTTREDGTTATGQVTYALYGGNLGGPFSELFNGSTLCDKGEIELNGAGEFYTIVCEDGGCGKQSEHMVAECGTSVIGSTTLNITLTCK